MWNPWRENLKDTPKESLNWRLWYGVFGKKPIVLISLFRFLTRA